MEIFEYIKSRMNGFVEEFPEAMMRYEFDCVANQHVIEILPLSVSTVSDSGLDDEVL